MLVCKNCGSENAANARFCSQCGQPLDTAAADNGSDSTATITFGGAPAEAPRRSDADELAALNEADAAAVNALPEGSALMIVQRGPGAGSRYLLDTDVVTAGRHPDSDIFLDDVTVSRRHVEFRREAAGFTVVDVGSLNGTYVNRDRIDSVALASGDEVQIGKFRMIYFASDAGR